MKTPKKAKFEKMLEIFDNTHKMYTMENMLKWKEATKEHGWTDDEFDEELNKRIEEKRIA